MKIYVLVNMGMDSAWVSEAYSTYQEAYTALQDSDNFGADIQEICLSSIPEEELVDLPVEPEYVPQKLSKKESKRIEKIAKELGEAMAKKIQEDLRKFI